ncbi:hypothetical protein [Tychonema sp. BBK16]|uniref:hypothetical protein n=1 Tax=Tychonema sp. BBK16 TaxID=2699888 RepID=UPI001F3FDD05|nr:hypothetical protein [Tychonema sp. BBK16]MCF6374881.1 hypothetical protein [Tychonema sp. BBK16]
MMEDDDQKDSRRASAQSFFESLDELFDYIEASSPAAESPSATVESKPSSPSKKARPAKINLSDFEDAIADLEQFIQKKNQKRPEVKE